ncbi:Mut7-C RNAse domain-containing protein [Hydrogenimonas sp.]
MTRFCTRWGKPRFVCDVHLAKVAKYLRLLGFDTFYRNDISDDELIARTRCGRIGVTCDRRLQSRAPGRIVVLRCEGAEEQVRRLAAIFSLARHARPFRRSLCCNRLVEPVPKAAAWPQVPTETYRWLSGYWRCPKCKKVYWKGTHAKRMHRKILELLSVSGKSDEKRAGGKCVESNGGDP